MESIETRSPQHQDFLSKPYICATPFGAGYANKQPEIIFLDLFRAQNVFSWQASCIALRHRVSHSTVTLFIAHRTNYCDPQITVTALIVHCINYRLGSSANQKCHICVPIVCREHINWTSELLVVEWLRYLVGIFCASLEPPNSHTMKVLKKWKPFSFSLLYIYVYTFLFFTVEGVSSATLLNSRASQVARHKKHVWGVGYHILRFDFVFAAFLWQMGLP